MEKEEVELKKEVNSCLSRYVDSTYHDYDECWTVITSRHMSTNIPIYYAAVWKLDLETRGGQESKRAYQNARESTQNLELI